MFKVTKNVCNTNNSAFGKIRQGEFSIEEDDKASFFKEEHVEFLPEKFFAEKEKRNIVIACIDNLPSPYKEILVLKHFEDMSNTEISETLDLSIKVVYNGLARGKKRLKELLEGKTGHVYGTIPVPVGSIPMLTKIMAANSEDVISEEVIHHLSIEAKEAINNSPNQSSTGSNAAIKALISLVVAVSIVAGGWQNIMAEHPDPIIHQAIPVAEETPPVTAIKSIETLEDMIGTDYAAQLMDFTEKGVSDSNTWQQFLETIGMVSESKGGSDEKTFNVYSLDKEDKRLVIVSLGNDSGDISKVIYEFGYQTKVSIPVGIEIINLF